jgi:hypothetical protein
MRRSRRDYLTDRWRRQGLNQFRKFGRGRFRCRGSRVISRSRRGGYGECIVLLRDRKLAAHDAISGSPAAKGASRRFKLLAECDRHRFATHPRNGKILAISTLRLIVHIGLASLI